MSPDVTTIELRNDLSEIGRLAVALEEFADRHALPPRVLTQMNLAIEEYLIQSATNSAVVAYRLGCAPTLLPRAKSDTAGERPNMLRREQQSTPPAPAAPTPNPNRS